MNVQVIMREGQPEYAVLPWAEYQALLQSVGNAPAVVNSSQVRTPAETARLTQLSALRSARGMSPDELARTVGISPHYLALIESGERSAEGAIARALARALGIAGWEDAD